VEWCTPRATWPAAPGCPPPRPAVVRECHGSMAARCAAQPRAAGAWKVCPGGWLHVP
jgi:hypothetical protein